LIKLELASRSQAQVLPDVANLCMKYGVILDVKITRDGSRLTAVVEMATALEAMLVHRVIGESQHGHFVNIDLYKKTNSP
jgi:hypothetical protein